MDPINIRLLKKAALFAAGNAALGLVLGAVAPDTRREAPTPREISEAHDRIVSRLRDGFADEVVLTRSGAPGEVERSVDSVVRLVGARSGVAIDDAVQARLGDLERRVASGAGRRLTVDEVSAMFAATLADRVRDCTDEEIDRATDDFGNAVVFGPRETAPPDASRRQEIVAAVRRARATGRPVDDPQAAALPLRRAVMLRYDGRGSVSTEKFVAAIKEARSRLQAPQAYVAAIEMARGGIRQEIDSRLALFGEAVPSAWGRAEQDGLTPVQALVLAYSLASDDDLVTPTRDLEASVARACGRGVIAPSTDAKAETAVGFGPRGLYFSSPVDLVFDARTLDALLDRMEGGITR